MPHGISKSPMEKKTMLNMVYNTVVTGFLCVGLKAGAFFSKIALVELNWTVLLVSFNIVTYRKYRGSFYACCLIENMIGLRQLVPLVKLSKQLCVRTPYFLYKTFTIRLIKCKNKTFY